MKNIGNACLLSNEITDNFGITQEYNERHSFQICNHEVIEWNSILSSRALNIKKSKINNFNPKFITFDVE